MARAGRLFFLSPERQRPSGFESRSRHFKYPLVLPGPSAPSSRLTRGRASSRDGWNSRAEPVGGRGRVRDGRSPAGRPSSSQDSPLLQPSMGRGGRPAGPSCSSSCRPRWRTVSTPGQNPCRSSPPEEKPSSFTTDGSTEAAFEGESRRRKDLAFGFEVHGSDGGHTLVDGERTPPLALWFPARGWSLGTA